jgi:hypothetical protein
MYFIHTEARILRRENNRQTDRLTDRQAGRQAKINK